MSKVSYFLEYTYVNGFADRITVIKNFKTKRELNKHLAEVQKELNVIDVKMRIRGLRTKLSLV